jgi:TRAP-type C4-dicarboxylate transport system permease small subunit
MDPYIVESKSSYSLWERTWKTLELMQKFICLVTCVIIVCLVAMTVACRYFFRVDVAGAEELLWMIGFWMFFLGASLGSQERSHISADVLTTMLKSHKARMLVSVFRGVVTSGLSIYVAMLAVDLVLWSMRMNPKSPTLRLPVVYAQAGIAVGCVLMAFYSVFYTIRDFLLLRSGELSEATDMIEDSNIIHGQR